MEGGPKKVGWNFECEHNQLVNLEGSPKNVSGDFWCSDNPLVSLEGGPVKVGSGFRCCNANLINLEGCPKEVGGSFWCQDNNLVDFVGLENTNIGQNIYPIWNADISRLPEGRADNTIVSLKGLREEYYDKVQDLDVESIKARELDSALDVMV